MRIFPKNINEKIYNLHLSVYSKTLISYISEIKGIVPSEYHHLLPHRVYICPLCLKKYFLKTNSELIGNSEFSMDHLPPQSTGGTHKIITCKKCNNDAGGDESELEKILNFGVNKTKPDAGISFKVRVGEMGTDKFVQGVVNNKNGETEINFDKNRKKYRKEYVDFLNLLHSNSIGKLTVNIPLYDIYKLERALLKSAYLMCFFWWGYEFAFSENGSLIRDVIAGKRSYPCQVPFKWSGGGNVMHNGVSILHDGDERVAFLVNIKLKGIEVDTTASILIPSPTKDGWAKLAIFKELNKGNESKEFKCITLPRIVDRIGYTISWGIIIPENGFSL